LLVLEYMYNRQWWCYLCFLILKYSTVNNVRLDGLPLTTIPSTAHAGLLSKKNISLVNMALSKAAMEERCKMDLLLRMHIVAKHSKKMIMCIKKSQSLVEPWQKSKHYCLPSHTTSGWKHKEGSKGWSLNLSYMVTIFLLLLCLTRKGHWCYSSSLL